MPGRAEVTPQPEGIKAMGNHEHPTLACEDCNAFSKSNDASTVGRCHLHPPTVIADGATKWPEVRLRDWCQHHTTSTTSTERLPYTQRAPRDEPTSTE